MMALDHSNGWDAVAEQLIQARRENRIGAEVIHLWSQDLAAGMSVLDLGCGSGEPVSTMLAAQGCEMFGVDASPRLVAEYRRLLPQARFECAPVEDSRFLDLQFDAVVAIGLLFLLPAAAQRQLLARMAAALQSRGRLLFSAPLQPCEWTDLLTGRRSVSLGADEYVRQLQAAGMKLLVTHVDHGGNHYFSAQKATP